MTRAAFQRDGILSDGERAASARKCLRLLAGLSSEHLRMRDYEFLLKQREVSSRLDYAPSEPQLQWLRDLVSRYVT